MEVALSALLVLIPTFIFGWALYAHGQARTTALNGARYAAWERTVWKANPVSGAAAAVRSESVIEQHMVERIFGKPDAVIRSAYTTSNQSGNQDLASFYSLHNGGKVIDIQKSESDAGEGEAARPTLSLEDSGRTTSIISSLYNEVAGLMNSLSFLGGGDKMKLEEQGLYVAEVKVKLNAVPNVKVLQDLDLKITQRAAVVTDAWSAGGKKHEEAIVKPLVPAAALWDLIRPLVEMINGLPFDMSPFQNMKLGCIRGDVVPVDMRISSSGGNSNSYTTGYVYDWENGTFTTKFVPGYKKETEICR
ncbi:MAG: hypothetical protein FWD51_00355 [Betaproteobacteria bacterium]|nr:hypothetical protein [Betaproteobacteria bacterium]